MNTPLMDVYIDGKLHKRRIVSYYYPPAAGLPPMPEPELKEGEEIHRTLGDVIPTIIQVAKQSRSFTLEISMNRTEWEDRVTDLLADQLEITRSDAQAVMEANESLVEAMWTSGTKPVAAAELLAKD